MKDVSNHEKNKVTSLTVKYGILKENAWPKSSNDGNNWFEVCDEENTVISVEEKNGILTTVCIAPLRLDRKGIKNFDNTKLLARQQSKKTSYSCPFCGNLFRIAGPFKIHLNSCERTFDQNLSMPQCETCKKTFSSNAALRRHRLAHSNITPMKCEQCTRKYYDKEKYMEHVQQHEHKRKLQELAGITGLSIAECEDAYIVVKEFYCMFCKQPFVVKFNSNEVKVRYACDDCCQKERERQNQHQNEKHEKLICERCGRWYKMEAFLCRHLTTCDGTIKPGGKKMSVDLMRL